MTSGKTAASGTISALIDSQLILCLLGSHAEQLTIAMAYDRNNTCPLTLKDAHAPMLQPVLAHAGNQQAAAPLLRTAVRADKHWMAHK